jgi:ABC-2 type transport system permease protein
MSGLFLFIFSFVIKSTSRGLDHPMNYLISGIIIMTVFQSALSNSMNILEDISSGFMKEILVAPINRWQIAIGHVLSAMVVSVIQGLIIVVIGLFMGLSIDFLHSIAMVVLMFLVGLTFSALGLYLATLTKESSNFQLLITIVSFPLTFLSGAYIPTMALPKILLPLVYLNPLTYTTAAFRFLTLHMENMPVSGLVKAGVAFDVNGFIITPLMSILLIITMCVLFFSLCVSRFNTADFSKVKIFRHSH